MKRLASRPDIAPQYQFQLQRKHFVQFPNLHQMLNLVHVQLNMRVHLQILIMGRVDLILDILFQVGHLRAKPRRLASHPPNNQHQNSYAKNNVPSFPSARS